ncbi:acetoin utilization deacetylase AcuC-like enzyme [Rhodoligotrophos appendicifer]|uniref:hypothetical protein n=1 Tax=Rhodoligotrophos appendicifer TaxID=987056 RepID=UPI00147865A1|nr:hypothetical protein [Rhodoligotrophos appendicifer]
MSSSERLAVFWHDDCLKHDTGAGVFEGIPSPYLDIQMAHPESNDRIVNMRSVLKRGPVSGHIDWNEGRHATDEELLSWCTPDLLHLLKQGDREGHNFALSTLMKPGALIAIRASAGCALMAMEAILDERTRKAYALVRPPGHHASREYVDGYCFINNIGLSVEHAMRRGIKRVAVIDWDVHHGNGTQAGFYDRADVLTISMHMNHGRWAGEGHAQTGYTDERGDGAGKGFNINIPFPYGIGDAGYLLAWDSIVAPSVRNFEPDLIIIANGQDASQFDPNGRQCVTMNGFYELGKRARALAEELTGGKLLMVQEGGYNPAYAAYCAHAVVEGILGLEMKLLDPIAFMPDDTFYARESIAQISRALELPFSWQQP